MKQGDTFKDTDGKSWTLGEPLGRGSLTCAWSARSEDGRAAVVKVALTADDISGDAPVPNGFEEASKQALLELGDVLRAGERPFLPRLIDTLDLAPGKRKNPKTPALLVHRYQATLGGRLAQGAPVGETLRILARVLAQLETMAKDGVSHGNLRPENILLSEAGEPVLDDPLTPTSAAWRPHFPTLSGRPSLLPPEASAPGESDDAFALCAMAWLAAMAEPGADPRHIEQLSIPVDIDKVDLATVRDATLASLKRGSANTRFATRVAERLGAMLSRGLAGPIEPSPPYRFLTLKDLAPRLREVASLVDPRVAEVGKVLLASAADASGVFSGGDRVEFSVSCGATSHNIGHEDIAVGLKVLDLDADGDARVQVPGTQFDVSSHPSGRLRFNFALPELAPGRYGVDVAFSIRDSGHDPTLAKGQFEVRPPPGYVPPEPEPERADAPLQLPPRPRPTPAPPMPAPTPTQAETEAHADVVPLPIAPSSVGIAPSDPGVPPSDPGLPPEESARPLTERTENDRTVPAFPRGMVVDDPSEPEIRSAPPIARPAPVVSLASIAPAPAPTAPPMPAPISPPVPAPAPPPSPVPMQVAPPPALTPPPAPPPVSGPGTWESDLPSPSQVTLPPDDYLPGQKLDQLGEDLPTWDERSRKLPPAVQRVVDLIAQDPFTAVAAMTLVIAVFVAFLFAVR